MWLQWIERAAMYTITESLKSHAKREDNVINTHLFLERVNRGVVSALSGKCRNVSLGNAGLHSSGKCFKNVRQSSHPHLQRWSSFSSVFRNSNKNVEVLKLDSCPVWVNTLTVSPLDFCPASGRHSRLHVHWFCYLDLYEYKRKAGFK